MLKHAFHQSMSVKLQQNLVHLKKLLAHRKVPLFEIGSIIITVPPNTSSSSPADHWKIL